VAISAAILNAILNYTFLLHIWNVYPSFLKSPMGALQGPRVKIRGHDCTQDPPQPQDHVLNSDSVAVFKSRLKTFLFSQAFSSSSAH